MKKYIFNLLILVLGANSYGQAQQQKILLSDLNLDQVAENNAIDQKKTSTINKSLSTSVLKLPLYTPVVAWIFWSC